MSGLLRRIKRSRAADAGETPAEGQAAAPEGAPTTAETTAGGDAVNVERAPMTAESAAERAPATLRAGAPLPQADPNVPAGLDPAEVAAQPVTGRRGLLRRRLRYLRRARELMLRDLGGLLYEVHRTGGGDVATHATVIGAKVQRLASLDAEAHSIETALGAPRSEAVVFQPGVGGTCDFCGELYGSAARFCSHCGSPTGSAVRATPAHTPAPRPVPAMPKPPAAATGERPTQVLAPLGGAAAPEHEGPTGEIKAADETAGLAPAGRHETPADETNAPGDETNAPAGETNAPGDETNAPADETQAPGEETNAPVDETNASPNETNAPADETNAPPDEAKAPADDSVRPEEPGAGDAARNPFAGMSNGRADDGSPPELSSGDPLATPERS